MPDSLPPPLGGPSPSEVSLPHAPLAAVLAQLRFPGILKIDSKEAVAPFQEQVRRDYPLFEQEPTQQIEVQMGPSGPTVRQVAGNAWRFRDASKHWRVSLLTDSVSIETDNYASRNDFLARWTKILAAIERNFEPQIALRIGMRYIDRITEEPLEIIDQLVRSDVLGVAHPPLRKHVRHALSEASLAIDEGQMLLRWGVMPPNGTIDPLVLKPIPEVSWILDIDVSSDMQRPFAHAALEGCFRALAARAYSVFRYITTERFLKTYGATP
jgi:uncharacterized protein (TIGR04255 family)